MATLKVLASSVEPGIFQRALLQATVPGHCHLGEAVSDSSDQQGPYISGVRRSQNWVTPPHNVMAGT